MHLHLAQTLLRACSVLGQDISAWEPVVEDQIKVIMVAEKIKRFFARIRRETGC